MSSIFLDRLSEIQTINPENYTPKTTLDTQKVCFPNGKFYIHSGAICHTRKEVRQILSQESGGAWIEQTGQKQRYFLDKGWISSNIYEVGKEEFFNSQNRGTFVQKVTGLALGALSLAPGVITASQQLPFREIPSQNVALALLAVQQKNPGIALLGSCASTQMPTSPEFQVNTKTLSDQEKPDVAGLSDGGFVVVWESDDTSQTGVFGQRFDERGDKIGQEFQVNEHEQQKQQNPKVLGLPSGGFFVTWDGYTDITTFQDIYGRFYDSAGTPSPEFIINTPEPYTMDIQTTPFVTSISSSSFLVTWFGGDSILDTFGKIYDNNGSAILSPFPITESEEDVIFNDVAGLGSDEFIVVWSGNSPTNTTSDFYDLTGQRYVLGDPEDSEFFITSTSSEGSVIGLTVGGFVATWIAPGQNGSTDVIGQLYESNGAPQLGNFQVNTDTASHKNHPELAPLTDGHFLIVWESTGQDGSGSGIYGQLYGPNRQKRGREFQVNAETNMDQSAPAASTLANGDYVIVWESFLQDGDGEGIFGQVYGNFSTTTSSTTSSISTTSSSSHYSTTSPPFGSPTTLHTIASSSYASTHTPLLSTFRENPTYASSSSIPPTSTSSSLSPTTLSPNVTIITYDSINPIYIDGTQVGTFTITGGSGSIDPRNDNIITLDFSDNYFPEDGETITLFTYAETNGANFNFVIEGDKSCYDINGQHYAIEEQTVFEDDGSTSYQLVFEQTSCTEFGIGSKFSSMLSLTSQL